MTRAALRASMSTAEFTDWLALYALEAADRKAEANRRR
jgi:hypothetical protein